jgi:hypothetical protein
LKLSAVGDAEGVDDGADVVGDAEMEGAFEGALKFEHRAAVLEFIIDTPPNHGGLPEVSYLDGLSDGESEGLADTVGADVGRNRETFPFTSGSVNLPEPKSSPPPPASAVPPRPTITLIANENKETFILLLLLSETFMEVLSNLAPLERLQST